MLLRTLGRRRRLHSAARIWAPAPVPVPTSNLLGLTSPLPVTPTCPPPTCPCEAAPGDLDIDRATPLAGTMASYYRHLLVSTGRSDWGKKIEDDGHGVAAQVKALAAQKGKNLRDPFAPTLITNSSFPPAGEEGRAAVYVFPSGLYIPRLPVTASALTALLRDLLLPPGPYTTRGPRVEEEFEGVRRVRETVVLICSHAARDSRCGVMAGPLKAQFEKVLRKRGVLLTEEEEEEEGRGEGEGRVRVGYTSHLSGHKFAGNVIVYLPPREEGGEGVGVWYGRVETRHVEGIVDETVCARRVVGELCRGVVGGGEEGTEM